MDALIDFLHMGGYAVYVWTSYAITTLVLMLNVWLPMRHGKAQRRQLRRALANNNASSSQ